MASTRRYRAGISGGVDLSVPPRVKHAVLDALNMESDGSAVRTRPGWERFCRGAAQSGTLATSVVYWPADWAGDSTLYVGMVYASAPPAGTHVGVSINFSDDTETVERVGLAFAYWNGSAWTTLEVDTAYLDHVDPLFFPPTGAHSPYIFFIVPDDMVWSADPATSGTSGGWIRIIRTGACAGHPTGAGVSVHTLDLVGGRPYFFKSRRADRLIAVTGAGSNVEGGRSVAIAELDDIRTDFRYKVVLSSPSLYDFGSEDVFFALSLYVTSLDAVVVHVADAWFKFNDTDLGQDDGNATVLEPWVIDSTATDTAWEDIPLRAALPRATAIALFNKRIFIVTNEGVVMWSAPDEFADIWPSENEYRLEASGNRTSMIAFQGALYIFTNRGIYRAVEGSAVEGQDSLVAFSLVEQTGCVNGYSVAAGDDGIYFVADDGIRRFNGQSSRLVSDGVEDLFRPDTDHPYAVMRKETLTAVYDFARRRYIVAYSLADSLENDAALVYEEDTRACWIWGPVPTSGMTTATGQRSMGFRATGMCYDSSSESVVIVDSDAFYARITGEKDAGSPVQWKLETHHMGDGHDGQVMSRVQVIAERRHYNPIKIDIVADGRRVDSREVSIQADGGDTTSVLGQANLAGEALTEDDEAHAPYIWRGASRARNHRVRVRSASPIHAPITIVDIEGVVAK